ncbi:MAG: SDR family oxidoreductase [Clostridia bacterium]|nr:SDR family oxidoreductase [Clostridia bacterium]
MGILERMRLDGKAGFVTGGARGIGKAVSLALCEAGADIAIVDIDIDEASKTAEWLRTETGRDVCAIRADVTSQSDVNAMIDQVLSRYNRLDIAFCNAGICINVPAAEMTLEQWNQVIGINLTGVFLTAQAAGKVMIKQGSGSIINTASMSGHIVNVPQPQCAYNASKAGVIQLTKSLAVEWALTGVRVNSLSPGYIGTELILAAPHLTALIDEWNSIAPMRRLGKPEELQSIVVYLAGDTSSFTTGSDFVVDGAFTAF